MSAILTSIIELLTGGLTGMATGIGGGLNQAVTNLFLVTGEGGVQTLSTFGSVVAIFAGIALAVGLTTLVTKWVMSLGSRH